MYADSVTPSMERAITETNRRRDIQQAYNIANGITPKSVVKDIRDIIEMSSKPDESKPVKKMNRQEKDKLIASLTAQMQEAARMLEFEHAAYLRDKINKLKG